VKGVERIGARIAAANAEGRSALVPFVVAGRPTRASFAETLREVAFSADLVEIGLPFSDPIADGPVIARTSRAALDDGVRLEWVLDVVADLELEAPPILFSYLNPLLARGLEETLVAAARAGFAGLVIPDLTQLARNDEARALEGLCAEHGLAWIQIVTPATGPQRRDSILRVARGFLYAALRTGITGARTDALDAAAFLDGLREASPVPVCAGFGLRDLEQARVLREHADGLIVGTALVEAIEAGQSPTLLLQPLREAARRNQP